MGQPKSQTELRNLLRSLDDPTHAEWPPDFDEKAVRTKFMRLVQTIVQEFGTSATYEAGSPLIQDASFFADLTIPAEATHSGIEIGIRTSNFGDLATIVVTDPDLAPDAPALAALIDEKDLHAVEELLANGGYQYIPLTLLHTDYDGSHQRLKDPYSSEGRRLTWWERYFDWF
ncbi:MAG TPA: hypothetical protein VK488_13020 [Gaiellaceae bacterium]|nr:hypothetical protein [Gaiellaceae bacterium]